MSETVLVTGGAGFIGSHLVERLVSEGHRVIVIDDLSTGSLENLEPVQGHPRFEFVESSILNTPLMDGLIGRCDRVIHLAASVGVRKILEKPVETIITNVRGTDVVVDSCERYNRPVWIASTSEIYGKAGGQLHEEHDRVIGASSKHRWAYACTKALDEFLALAYYQERGLPVVIGRLFNTVGPRQTGQWGMVVPTLVAQALRREPLTVYGTGEQMRCFCHVEDTVDAILRLVYAPEAVGEIFNIGTEKEISILELARRVLHITGSESEILLVPYTEAYGPGFEDMERRQPDISKIQTAVGWRPRRSLDDIIAEVAAHLESASMATAPLSGTIL